MHRGNLLLLMFAVLSITGCSSPLPEEEDTSMPTSICNSEDFPLPHYNVEGSAAWTWSGITVGITTEDELLAKLGEPSSITAWPSNEPQACIYRYQDLNNHPTFWLADSKVVGACFSTYDEQTRLDGQPATFNQAKELYGRAEIVGWTLSLGAGYRSVVWLRYGVLAEISYRGKQNIGTITYFMPMNEEEFRNSVWSTLVMETNPTTKTDNVDTYPQDPFNWE